MILFPHCKINLGLNIVAKRKDGYHNLETLFYPIPLCDSLELVAGNTIGEDDAGIISEGLKIEGDPKNNLILKAYYLLKEKYPLPRVTFCLLKTIPMGAGLGGGSSDGASAIQLLNQYFNLNIPFEEQINYASKLGSDCAYFLYDGACLGSGRGEILEPINFSLNGTWIVLVKPNLHISTAEAFANINTLGQNNLQSIKETIIRPIQQWKDNLKNDFEDSLFPKYPELKEIKDQLYANGAKYVAMSGSGSTLFGLFDAEPTIKDQFGEHFYWQGMLN
jgi:4-diphosphocytidyl-2-C-methyl-D-erythritol kinase